MERSGSVRRISNSVPFSERVDRFLRSNKTFAASYLVSHIEGTCVTFRSRAMIERIAGDAAHCMTLH